MFTDIEGSTGLWESAPEAMRVALERHDAILRGAIEANGGYVFSTGGDGFAAAFPRAGDALAAAVAAQQALTQEPWAEETPIRVRMGVHTGEAAERDGDYFGPAVNRAARVMGAAPGGQIVVSSVTAELTGGRADITMVDLGSLRLRGVTEPVRLFGVQADGLGSFEGRLATDRGVPGNLPRPLTEMVGRTAELKHLVSELGGRRLVTLTGPGGVGKTRLAVEAGWLASVEFTDGVWFIDLGPVTDPAAVPFTAATTLMAQPRDGLSVEDAIVDVLAGCRALLIVDNCEHLREATVSLVRRIVTDCPAVTVLATSREPLGLPGERVHTVASLDPVLEGVELFCERATAADDTFVCDDADAVVIAEICTRLDGIPLAIELAAARVRSMTPSDLLDRLRDRFRVLRGGAEGGVERHQTLRATVAWSYQLLTEVERVVFERISVFAGGFDLAAATAVCVGSGGDLDEVDIDDVLTSLVDKSMVMMDRSSRTTRYRQLETIRQYGEERLSDRGDAAVVRDLHFAHYLMVAEKAFAAWSGPGQIAVVHTAEREWDNLRAAFDWVRASGHDERAIAFVLACARFAQPCLRFEHRQWIDSLLPKVPLDHPLRCCLYAHTADWAAMAGDHEQAIRLAWLGLDLADNCPDPLGPWLCWLALAIALVSSARGDEAMAAVRSAQVFVGEDAYREVVWLIVATLVARFFDPAAIPQYNARFGEVAAALGAPLWIASHLCSTGSHHLLDGRPGEARRDYQEALRLCEDTKTTARGTALVGSALAAVALDHDEAPKIFRDTLGELYEMNSWLGVWMAIEELLIDWVLTGALEPGAVAAAHLEAHGHAHPTFAIRRAEATAILRAHPETADAQTRGTAMTRDQLVTYILNQLEVSTERSER